MSVRRRYGTTDPYQQDGHDRPSNGPRPPRWRYPRLALLRGCRSGTSPARAWVAGIAIAARMTLLATGIAAGADERPAPQTAAAPSPAPGPRFVAPQDGAVLDGPAAQVVLQFPAGSSVALEVNGAAVDASLVGRTETDPAAGTVTQTWY